MRAGPITLARRAGTALVCAALLPAAPAAWAEAGHERLLASAAVTEQGSCAVVRIDFHVRVQYLTHIPEAGGDELRIRINAIDQVAGDVRSGSMPETLRAPGSERAAIHAIELETVSGIMTLNVFFKRNVAYKVAQGIDFKSVLIAVSDPRDAARCAISHDLVAAGTAPPVRNGWRAGKPEAGGAVEAPSGPSTPQQRDQLMSEARAALDKGNADRAVQLLTKLIATGDETFHEPAQELLAVARDRRGQMAHARAEYQEYLRLFPNGPAAQRIRERLAAIEGSSKAASTPASVADGAGTVAGAEPKSATIKLGSDVKAGGPTLRGTQGEGTFLPQQPAAPAGNTVSQYGSLSTYYNMNQGGRGFIEVPRTNVGWSQENPYQTYQSALLTNFDYELRIDNASAAQRIKFSATDQTNLTGHDPDQFRITSLYYDGRFKDTGIDTRIGRQSATTGGVLGRFDGAIAGYQATDTVKLNAIVGSPVELASASPFATGSWFYGASADVSHFGRALQTTGYVIEQRTDGFIDRQAVGSEIRYVKDSTSLYSAAEYDVHFGEFNSAVFTGNRVFEDRSTASVNLDYRRAPILLVSNALLGQGVYSLKALLGQYTASEIDQLALDRTAESFTATATYSRPVNSWLQWAADLTVNNVSGTPASGGVDAVASTGMAYYASAQLIGSGLTVDGDSGNAGVRFADTTTSDRYMLDFGYNYPLTHDWRVNPKMQLAYAGYKTESRQDYEFIPSLRTTYAARSDITLEMEIGGKLGLTNSSAGRELQNELLVLAGVRYDFSR